MSDIPVQLEFVWTLAADITVEQEFYWDTGDLPLNWYQVSGACGYGVNCENSGVDSDDENCTGLMGQRFLKIASGRSVADLCTNLANNARPIKWKIDSIKKYTRPIYTTVGESDCETLESQSWCEVPSCAEFCLTVDGTSLIGVTIGGMRVMRGSGGVISGGVAGRRIVPPKKVGEGSISVEGAAAFKSSAWLFVPCDTPPGVIVDGMATHKSSAYQFVSSGDIALDGVAGVVSSEWSPAVGGFIYATGAGVVEARGNVEYVSEGGISLEGSAIVYGKDYQFIYEGGGSVSVSGIAEASATDRIFDASGAVATGGTARFVSSSFNIYSTGQLTLGGDCALGYRHNSQGGLGISGEASVIYRHNASGGVAIGGVSHFISSGYVARGDGNVSVSGNASINYFTGLVEIGVITSVVEEGRYVLEPSTDPIPVASPEYINTNCSGYSMTPQIELRHNLADNNALGDFLVRSGNTIPDRIFLSYLKDYNVWKWNTHYFTTEGIWDLLLQFSCTDKLGDLELGQMVWKLNFVILRIEDGITKATRFATAFDAETVRLSNGILSLEASFNVVTRIVTSTAKTSQFLIFEDRIGLFSNDSWKESPELKFYISEINTPDWSNNYQMYSSISEQGFPTNNVGGVLGGYLWTPPPAGTAAEKMGPPPYYISTITPTATVSSIFEPATVPINGDVEVTVGVESGTVQKPSPYKKITRQKEKITVPLITRKQQFRIFNKD